MSELFEECQESETGICLALSCAKNLRHIFLSLNIFNFYPGKSKQASFYQEPCSSILL